MLTKRRILVTRFPYESRLGGEEIHTLSLMKALRERGHAVFFMGFCRVLYREFRKAGFPVLWMNGIVPPVTPFYLILFTLFSPIVFFWSGLCLLLAKLIWRVDTLYALSFGEKLMMTPWAALFGIRVIWLEHARIGNWLIKNPWKPWYRFLAGRPGVQTVLTSEAMKKRWVEAVGGGPSGAGVARAEAIACWVDLPEPGALKAEWLDFMDKGFTVGTVCRLTEDKGVDTVVKLVESQPDIRLVLVGEGPLAGLIRQSPARDRILLIPHLDRPELSALYRSMDIFVLASTKFDPFGMVAAEAMRSGTATVVTEECGIAGDLVDRETALVVPANFDALNGAVASLKGDAGLRERLGKAGEEFARKTYAMNQLVGQFEELMSEDQVPSR